MKIVDSPAKQGVPFGINGLREPLLPSTPAGDNTASYADGFPSITMILKSAGGLPPKGQDMNQVLFELSSLCRWFSAGAMNKFDSAFCTAIGGYPKGALLLAGDGVTIFKCTQDDNTNNPDQSATGWKRLSYYVADELALGNAAYKDVGTTSGTVAAGDATMGGTYTNVTSSRVMGVTYTNSATRPMLVIYSCDATSFGTAVAAVNGANVARVIGVESSATHNGPSMTFIVPAGATYSITKTAGSLSNMIWAEMV
ncbi:hypothetical protein JFQ92_002248 [Edwardsiella piscicida]|uniref:hypothetical protein n=1 Tax=Edwardsiella piscicida TaxID=1263550 RepID=UPI0015E7F6AD|nr:hypothetical protein [Edwardsiella piscicida]EKS7767142.1 hypothetical protein [Edwardsiella piscicida]ELM3659821.1 hypothetical protein [Edwardsiella piscicida]UCQ29716.1 hypothetical protein DCF74_09405 [Edwardsiella piscicida]UCQ36374.1 hypothetical protein DCF36_08925 [Edwardsiella piscicida]